MTNTNITDFHPGADAFKQAEDALVASPQPVDAEWSGHTFQADQATNKAPVLPPVIPKGVPRETSPLPKELQPAKANVLTPELVGEAEILDARDPRLHKIMKANDKAMRPKVRVDYDMLLRTYNRMEVSQVAILYVPDTARRSNMITVFAQRGIYNFSDYVLTRAKHLDKEGYMAFSVQRLSASIADILK